MKHEFVQEYKQIGLKLAYYRKLQGYTQEGLAEKLEVATSYIGQTEAAGMYKPISHFKVPQSGFMPRELYTRS